jgi:bile acid:Na+ symporter, BASS family
MVHRSANFVQQHLLWGLLGCYLLAGLFPAPGLSMRTWHLPSSVTGNWQVTVPLLLLAWMLFCAALLTDLNQIRGVLHHPLVLCVSLVAVWLGPALLVIVAGWVLPRLFDSPVTAELLVAMALVATMPVANSSVGWLQNSRGNLALGLALVVLSISLSPWTTPTLLELLGKSLSPAEQRSCEELVTRFSGWFFVVWVILPTALGFACRLTFTPRRVAPVAGWIALTSAAALLALNYINSALALPKAIDAPATLLLATAGMAIAMSVTGLAGAWAIASALQLSPEARSALLFGLSMKHTGLALILAGAVLTDKPFAILFIVLVTVAQHLLAGVVQWLHPRGDYGQLAAQRDTGS